MFPRIQQLEGEATANMNQLLQPSKTTDTAGNTNDLNFSDEEN
jgi:hypothetical protein